MRLNLDSRSRGCLTNGGPPRPPSLSPPACPGSIRRLCGRAQKGRLALGASGDLLCGPHACAEFLSSTLLQPPRANLRLRQFARAPAKPIAFVASHRRQAGQACRPSSLESVGASLLSASRPASFVLLLAGPNSTLVGLKLLQVFARPRLKSESVTGAARVNPLKWRTIFAPSTGQGSREPCARA